MITYSGKTKLTEEQIKLIENNLTFCYWYMNRMGVTDEDAQQNLLLAVCDNIHLYDPSKSELTTFLSVILSSRNKASYKQENALKRAGDKNNVSLYTVLYTNEDGDNLTWEDTLEYTETGFTSFENLDYYKSLIEMFKKNTRMTEDSFKILIAYLNTGNIKEVGRMYGCTHQNVSRICTHVRKELKKIKKMYDEEYLR